MKVYVAMTGCYEQTWIGGVYDSPERAMAAYPEGKWTKETTFDWETGKADVSWSNSLDWDAAVSIHEVELVDAGPERVEDQTSVQVYRPINGHWAYLTESPESLQLGQEATAYIRKHRSRNKWSEPEPTDIDRRIDVAMGAAAEKMDEVMGADG